MQVSCRHSPKYRRKIICGSLRREVGAILRELCWQKSIQLEEGKAIQEHIHMLLSVPPEYSIAMAKGYLKAKSAIRIHCHVLRTQGTLCGCSFWAQGYFVSTVGIDEVQIRKHIKEQEQMQKDQIEFDFH